MTRTYQVTIHNKQENTVKTITVPENQYILTTAEAQSVTPPFSCRNGACTTCAVRVMEGEIYQPEAMGLSPDLQRRGYALLCVSYPRSDLVVETQNEDEVYELQFGRFFGRGRVRFGFPIEED